MTKHLFSGVEAIATVAGLTRTTSVVYTIVIRLLLTALIAMILVGGGSKSFGQTNLVRDGGFEDNSPIQTFTRSPGNPWLPGEWNAEYADNVFGSTAGVSPFGTRMLRAYQEFVVSDVSQLIDVTGLVTVPTMAEFSIFINTPQGAPARGSLLLRAGAATTVVGTIEEPYVERRVSFTTDGDASTWTQARGTLLLPSGTNFMTLWLAIAGVDITWQGVFIDNASVTLPEPSGAGLACLGILGFGAPGFRRRYGTQSTS